MARKRLAAVETPGVIRGTVKASSSLIFIEWNDSVWEGGGFPTIRKDDFVKVQPPETAEPSLVNDVLEHVKGCGATSKLLPARKRKPAPLVVQGPVNVKQAIAEAFRAIKTDNPEGLKECIASIYRENSLCT